MIDGNGGIVNNGKIKLLGCKPRTLTVAYGETTTQGRTDAS